MKTKNIKQVLMVLALLVMPVLPVSAGASDTSGDLSLSSAVMCESVQDYTPVNPAVVFSIQLGRVLCFTDFSSISAQRYIRHKWYRHDRLVTDKRLVLKPPQWSSFSSVQLRDVDKGPWRVDITTDDGALIQTLRFSITD